MSCSASDGVGDGVAVGGGVAVGRGVWVLVCAGAGGIVGTSAVWVAYFSAAVCVSSGWLIQSGD